MAPTTGVLIAWKLPCYSILYLPTKVIYVFITQCEEITYICLRPFVAERHKCVTVNTTGCEFNPNSRKLNIYLNLYYHFFALALRQSVALSSATQHAMLHSSAENEKWSILTLVSLCILWLCARYIINLIKKDTYPRTFKKWVT